LRRRNFITLLGGAAAWPVAARAQQQVPVIGFLQGRTAQTAVKVVAAFRQGLRERGFVEGENVTIEYRYAGGHFEQLPALAADLVSQRVAVIAAGYPSDQAAKSATTTIPIVFMGGRDPVRSGLVASIPRPGGNITGVSLLAADLETKRIGLLHDVVPNVVVIGALVDPNVPDGEFQLQEVQAAARRIGLSVQAVRVGSERDLDTAFATLVQDRIGALIVAASTFFNIYHDRLVALAAQYRLPTIYELREFAEAGGLMTYGPSIAEVFRQGGIYTGRILKGEKPADLPVLLPTKFEMLINLKAAKTLGLTIPPGVLAVADEVIE
jgi:putative tryptophan/tyrosine transport system substrate-binding protein